MISMPLTKVIYRISQTLNLPNLATLEEFVMPAVVNRDECVSCGTCVEECPEEAITMDDEEIAVVNADKCTDCGTCVEACPSEAITLE
jgi:ferredoxin